MQITIWSDFMCPFCYIGEANLKQALEHVDHPDGVDVEYKSFLLSPDAKHDPAKDYYQTFADLKGMSIEQVKSSFQNVTKMADEAGILIDYDKAKFSSTIPAHQAFQYAKEQGKGNEFFQRFYLAHFEEGELLSDIETIVRLSEEIGLDGDAIRESINKKDYTNRVNQEIHEAGQVGVQGVPFYVINNKYAVSGAQPVASFIQVLEQVQNEEKGNK